MSDKKLDGWGREVDGYARTTVPGSGCLYVLEIEGDPMMVQEVVLQALHSARALSVKSSGCCGEGGTDASGPNLLG